MSSAPRRRPPGSRTRSRRKPVGGRSTSAATAIRRSASSRPGASANARASRSATVGRAPHGRALDDDREQHQAAVAVRVDDPLARRALPRVDRAGEQRARRGRAVAVGVQPARREAVEHARREHLHRRAQRPASSSPSQASAQSTSELGNGSRRPKLPSASHVNGAGGGPHSRDRQLDQAPRRRCRGRRRSCARSPAPPRPRRAARRPRAQLGHRRGDARHVGGARDERAQPERGAVLGGEQVDVVEHADAAAAARRAPAGGGCRGRASPAAPRSRGGRRRPCAPARSSRRRAACRAARPPRAPACAGRGR